MFMMISERMYISCIIGVSVNLSLEELVAILTSLDCKGA